MNESRKCDFFHKKLGSRILYTGIDSNMNDPRNPLIRYKKVYKEETYSSADVSQFSVSGNIVAEKKKKV